jgi:hypothetical protein
MENIAGSLIALLNERKRLDLRSPWRTILTEACLLAGFLLTCSLLTRG